MNSSPHSTGGVRRVPQCYNLGDSTMSLPFQAHQLGRVDDHLCRSLKVIPSLENDPEAEMIVDAGKEEKPRVGF